MISKELKRDLVIGFAFVIAIFVLGYILFPLKAEDFRIETHETNHFIGLREKWLNLDEYSYTYAVEVSGMDQVFFGEHGIITPEIKEYVNLTRDKDNLTKMLFIVEYKLKKRDNCFEITETIGNTSSVYCVAYEFKRDDVYPLFFINDLLLHMDANISASYGLRYQETAMVRVEPTTSYSEKQLGNITLSILYNDLCKALLDKNTGVPIMVSVGNKINGYAYWLINTSDPRIEKIILYSYGFEYD